MPPPSLAFVKGPHEKKWRRAGAAGEALAFSDITANPAGAAAWSQVQSQLQAEQQSGLLTANDFNDALLAAQGNFTDSYNGLNAAAADATSILPAATQYALQAQTVLGSVSNIQGFISAAQNPDTPPAALVTSFTGILVGIGIASGVVTAGVGAAVCAGVALAVQTLSSLGFFPSPPSGAPLCNGSVLVQPNDPGAIVIGCVAGNYPNLQQAKVPGPQDPRWRSFPSPTTDPGWYEVLESSGQTIAGPITWGSGLWSSGSNGPRMVDAAWPQFRHLECEQSSLLPGAAGAFQQAFFAAWKLNQALALNGQQVADDASVLKQLVTQWNRAHDGATTYSFTSRGTDTQFMPSNLSPGPSPCSRVASYGPYVSYLVQDIGGSLVINTGALKAPPNVSALTNNVSSAAPTATSGATTAAAIALGIGGVSLAAVGIYAVKEKISYLEAWQRLYNAIHQRR